MATAASSRLDDPRPSGRDPAASTPPVLGLVGPSAPWAGGIPQFTTSLAAELRDRARLEWLSWRPPRVLPPTTHLDPDAAVPPDVTAGLGPYDPLSWRRAGVLLCGVDAVVLTVTHPTLAAPYAVLVRAYRSRAQAGGRVVLLCHNVEDHERRPVLRPLTRRLLGLADAIVVHAAAEADLARRLGATAPVVEAFHPAYARWSERPFSAAPRARRLLFFGFVRAYKGLGDLIEALALLPDATLEVAGRFERGVAPYRAQARRLGVADRVRLDDRFVPDEEIPPTFHRADVVVAPYRQASQSGVVHLAYSLGRPVVATTVGGLVDAVQDGRTGLLTPPGDPRALAATIERVLARPPGAFDAGLRRVLADRSWTRYGATVLDAACGRRNRLFTARQPP